MSKKYGFAVYSSLLGGTLMSSDSREKCEKFITDYYAAYGTGERLSILNNYPL